MARTGTGQVIEMHAVGLRACNIIGVVDTVATGEFVLHKNLSCYSAQSYSWSSKDSNLILPDFLIFQLETWIFILVYPKMGKKRKKKKIVNLVWAWRKETHQ